MSCMFLVQVCDVWLCSKRSCALRGVPSCVSSYLEDLCVGGEGECGVLALFATLSVCSVSEVVERSFVE